MEKFVFAENLNKYRQPMFLDLLVPLSVSPMENFGVLASQTGYARDACAIDWFGGADLELIRKCAGAAWEREEKSTIDSSAPALPAAAHQQENSKHDVQSCTSDAGGILSYFEFVRNCAWMSWPCLSSDQFLSKEKTMCQ